MCAFCFLDWRNFVRFLEILVENLKPIQSDSKIRKSSDTTFVESVDGHLLTQERNKSKRKRVWTWTHEAIKLLHSSTTDA